MPGYYENKLAAQRLKRVYGLASDRVRQYLQAEIRFVAEHIRPGDRVLELGCGYGRVLAGLGHDPGRLVGIDTSLASLGMARSELGPRVGLAAMDAARLGFVDNRFDLVACVQNGISAFKVGPERLISEAYRVVRPGGWLLFSSYAESFWPDRLDWFRAQARAGLLGEIDESATGNGVIVCQDGFRATTFGPGDFTDLAEQLGYRAQVVEVDSSSLFAVIRKEDG